MDKTAIYAKALKETAPGIPPGSLPFLLQKFKRILASRGEEHLFTSVLRATILLFERESKTKVVSRYPLEEKTKQEAVAFLKKHFTDVEESAVEFETDRNSFGGVLLSHKDFLFDATMRRQLDKIFQQQ